MPQPFTFIIRKILKKCYEIGKKKRKKTISSSLLLDRTTDPNLLGGGFLVLFAGLPLQKGTSLPTLHKPVYPLTTTPENALKMQKVGVLSLRWHQR